jgi:integrase
MKFSGNLSLIEHVHDAEFRRIINVKGVDFEEEFIAKIISDYFVQSKNANRPKLSDALAIYLHESSAGDSKKFRGDAFHVFGRFVEKIGNLYLDELRHSHACYFRDQLLELGLKPVTVRRQTGILNAMINVAFKHLDVDRLSPFRSLKINCQQSPRPMRVITNELLCDVKKKLMWRFTPYKLIGLIQLNTGVRLSEPVYAKVSDCILDHQIPHIWVRQNELSNRKTKSSIRAVPLVGISLFAAKRLVEFAKELGSEWLVPRYARYHGSNSCSAALNKYLSSLDFRSHMFRHALIDRMKACNDIPTRLAESITGHYSGGSEFNNYGTVGYTLEQKVEVLKRIEI